MTETATERVEIRAPSSERLPRMLLAACVVLYVLVVGFVLPSGSKYHGDERFYTDAALRMCDTGDYWTPYFASGKIRLLKPIAAYWTVVGSFKAFGMSLFTSRLPSLAAGALTLILTFQLGRTMFRSDRIGAFAALVLASNIEFLTLSARATPDAQVTLWSLVSLLGFARIWFDPTPSRWGPFLAWGGIGLAIQTKGLLGLCPLGANLLFLWLSRPADARQKLRQFLDWQAMLLGLGLASFWYLMMVRLHGVASLRDFFDDQVGAKVSLSPGFILHNLFTYSMAGVRHFMPWTLLLVIGLIVARKTLGEFWRIHRAACIYLLVLFPILVVAFSFGNMRTSRYVMISYPGLAVLLAALVHAWWPHDGLQKALGRILPVLSGIFLVAGLVLAGISTRLGWRLAVAGSLLMALGAGGFLLSLGEPLVRRWCWLAALMLVFYGVFDGAVRPTSTPTPFASIHQLLSREGASGKVVYTWQVEETAASQLRLATHNTIHVQQLLRSNLHQEPAFILTTAAAKDKLPAEAYEFHRVELDEQAIRVRDALRPFRRTDRGRNTAGRNTEYWVAVHRRGEKPELTHE